MVWKSYTYVLDRCTIYIIIYVLLHTDHSVSGINRFIYRISYCFIARNQYIIKVLVDLTLCFFFRMYFKISNIGLIMCFLFLFNFDKAEIQKGNWFYQMCHTLDHHSRSLSTPFYPLYIRL